jgi:hypothetical protein
MAGTNSSGSPPTREPRRVRLPGFVRDEEIGLGDVIRRATTLMGVRSCRGCGQRAARLNQRVVFTPWRGR